MSDDLRAEARGWRERNDGGRLCAWWPAGSNPSDPEDKSQPILSVMWDHGGTGDLGVFYDQADAGKLIVDGLEYRLEDSPDGTHAVTRSDDRCQIALEIYCRTPPSVGEWRQLEPPRDGVSATFAVFDEHHVFDTQTPQQCALPRPSTTPPMWVDDPTRSRRRRS